MTYSKDEMHAAMAQASTLAYALYGLFRNPQTLADAEVFDRWGASVFAPPAPPTFPPVVHYWRESLGLSREGADSTSINRWAKLMGGGGWWLRDTPENPTGKEPATWTLVRQLGGRIYATGLLPTSGHALPDVTTAAGSQTWSDYVKRVLDQGVARFSWWNEPNEEAFSGGHPNPALTARLGVVAADVIRTGGYTCDLITPGFANRDDARTDPLAILPFWNAMVAAVPELVGVIAGVAGHPYSYYNNGLAATSAWQWNGATQIDMIASAIETAHGTGAKIVRWWDETGAPVFTSSTHGPAGSYIGSEDAQRLQVQDKLDTFAAQTRAGKAMGGVFFHTDVDNFAYDKGRGFDFGVFAQDGTTRRASANAIAAFAATAVA